MKKRPWLLALIVFLSHAVYFQDVAYDNVNARLDLIVAIAETGEFYIDPLADNTIDKAYYDGHFYCDKPPGLSLVSVPIYMAGKSFLSAFGRQWNLNLLRYVCRLVFVSLPAALLALLLYELVLAISGREDLALIIPMFYALGTPAFPYATVFYGHQVGAVLIFLGFYILWKDLPLAPFCRGFIVGVCLGGAFLFEYPTPLLALPVFIYGVCKQRENACIVGMIAGGALMLTLMGYYNTICFDRPWRMSYHFKWHPHFKEVHSQGFFGITFPSLKAAYVLFLSPRKGLFFFSPFLVLMFWGVRRLWERWRAEALLAAVSTLIYSLFIISFNDYEAGWTFGPRHGVPMLPFMILFLAAIPQRKPFLVILMALGTLSIIIFQLGTLANIHIPDNISHPLAEFFIPLLNHGILSSSIFILFWPSQIVAVITVIIVLLCIFLYLWRIVRLANLNYTFLLTTMLVIFLWFGFNLWQADFTPEEFLIIGDVFSFNEKYRSAELFYKLNGTELGEKKRLEVQNLLPDFP